MHGIGIMQNAFLIIEQQLLEYIAYSTLSSATNIPTNAYQRPIDTQKLSHADFSSPITSSEIRSEKNRLIHQLLFTIYEQDMLFLDGQFCDPETQKEFRAFYDPRFVAQG